MVSKFETGFIFIFLQFFFFLVTTKSIYEYSGAFKNIKNPSKFFFALVYHFLSFIQRGCDCDKNGI